MKTASNIVILSGRIIDPASGFDEVDDLYIVDGKLAGVGEAPAGFHADVRLDASGLLVLPGIVDLSARLGEPGGEHKKLLQSELAAAVAGGITTLCCPPDTEPALDEPSLVQMLCDRAAAIGLSKVLPLGALTHNLEGRELTEMAELRDAGCIAFSQADAPLGDTRVLHRAMQYASTYDLPLRLRPQDVRLAAGGVAHDGEVATRLGLAGIPAIAETIAIATIVILMRDTGARVHLERISSGESVEMVRAAKSYGLPLTCDVSIQHVHLADIDIGYFDTRARLSPPLRSVRDRDAIVHGLLDGTIDAICSDHSPIENDDKLLPFGEAKPGASALELLLPLTLAFAEQRHMSINQAIGLISSAPARILGVPSGLFENGSPADITIVNPQASWRATPQALRSHGKHTPFSDMELRAKVVYTLVDGVVVYGKSL